ncbi:MAG: symmetrical bis(5'-nucleosyl)-tetraphosphatase [Proteobacteria bacterium]|nr:symmetrical bis(5'-nucleosyl)-tetraphosphatase [Pseudomonadota bacterium]
MTTWAIGDLQGCYDPLQRLLEKIAFDPARDRLWFCGDLVNRGGQSLQTLRLVHSLSIHSTLVLGNHDLALLSIAQRREVEQRKVNPDLQAILFAPDRDALLDWLVSLPLLHVERAAGWCMLHAGLMPKWNIAIAEKRAREVESHLQGRDRDKLLRNMYGDKPAWSPKLKGIERDRAIINVFTRMRYCTAHGRIAFDAKGAPGTQTPGLYPWFAVPGQVRRELNIVCGHWSTLGLMIAGGVHAIDTGCVWGGPLTALELVPPRQPPRIVQVAGRTP